MSKVIRGLQHASNRDGALIAQQVNDIEDLQHKLKTSELVCGAKANVIKDLGGELKIVRDLRSKNVMEISRLDKAVAQLGRVIGEKDKDIKDLERRLELSERVSGNKEFHNATEAMGNPQYFQRVSND